VNLITHLGISVSVNGEEDELINSVIREEDGVKEYLENIVFENIPSLDNETLEIQSKLIQECLFETTYTIPEDVKYVD
jgi:hypothetical protein